MMETKWPINMNESGTVISEIFDLERDTTDETNEKIPEDSVSGKIVKSILDN